MQNVKFNLNHDVTLTLNESGVRIWLEYAASLPANSMTFVAGKLKTDNKLRIPAHDMISVFGPHVKIGSEPFDMNVLIHP